LFRQYVVPELWVGGFEEMTYSQEPWFNWEIDDLTTTGFSAEI